VRQVAITLITVLLLAAGPAFAQETKAVEAAESSETTAQNKKIFPTFSYGASTSWVTRIIKQTGRSSFVFREFLPGLYFTTELQNIPVVTPEARLSVFYPLISKFNDVRQALAPLNIGIDLFLGARFELKWNIVKFNAGLGLHTFFMTSSRWNYVNMGIGGVIGVELALSPGWSLLVNGLASFDNGNLGTNRNMEPFDIAYQYQSSIGVRYSKKKLNDVAAFMPKDNSRVIFDR